MQVVKGNKGVGDIKDYMWKYTKGVSGIPGDEGKSVSNTDGESITQSQQPHHRELSWRWCIPFISIGLSSGAPDIELNP